MQSNLTKKPSSTAIGYKFVISGILVILGILLIREFEAAINDLSLGIEIVYSANNDSLSRSSERNQAECEE